MRRALNVLLVLGLLAVFSTSASPTPVHADDSATVARVAIVSVDSSESILLPSSKPNWWGWGGWPWWAGMPLWQVSALSGGTWPWFSTWTPSWWGAWPSSWASGGGWPSWGSSWGSWGGFSPWGSWGGWPGIGVPPYPLGGTT